MRSFEMFTGMLQQQAATNHVNANGAIAFVVEQHTLAATLSELQWALQKIMATAAT